MANREMRFDIFKQPRLTPIIYGRVGDGSVQKVTVYLTANDEPIDLTGYTITFEGNTSGNKTVVLDTEGVSGIVANQGKFDYTFPNMAFDVPGEYERAYFSLTNITTKQRSTTSNFQVIVLDNADITADEAETIITEYNKLIDKLNKAYNDALANYTKAGDAMLADLKTKIGTLENKLNTLNTSYNSLAQKSEEIRKAIEALGNLHVMYSNSLDFGNYDYSGRPNLAPNLDFSKFSGNGITMTKPLACFKDYETYLELDSSDPSAANTSRNIYVPNCSALLPNNTYIMTVPMMIDTDFDDFRTAFIIKTRDGTALVTINPPRENVGTWQNVTKVFTVPSNLKFDTTYLQLWQPKESNGKIYIGYDIKIEKVNSTSDTATPYQPNLLGEPWNLSKREIGKNIRRLDAGNQLPITTTEYNCYVGRINGYWRAGKTYTITIKGTKPASQTFGLYLLNGAQNAGTLTPVEGLTDQWSLTFTPTQEMIDVGVTNHANLFQIPQSTKGEVKIEWVKIEENDTRTPNVDVLKYQGVGFQDSDSPKDYVWNLSRQYLENNVQNYPMTMDDGDAIPLANIEGAKASFADLKIHKKYILLSQAEAQAMTDYNTLPSTLRTPSGDASQISGYIVHNVPDVSPDRTIQFVHAMAYSATNLRIAFRRLYGGSATGWNETFRKADFDNLTALWQKAKLTNDDGNAFLLAQITSAKASLADLRLRKGYVYLTGAEMQAMTDYANIPESMKANTVGYILQNTPDIDTGSSVQILYTNVSNDSIQQRMAFRRVSPNVAKPWVEVATINEVKTLIEEAIEGARPEVPYEGWFGTGEELTNLKDGNRIRFGSEISNVGTRYGMKMKESPLTWNSGKWQASVNRDCTLLVEGNCRLQPAGEPAAYAYLVGYKGQNEKEGQIGFFGGRGTTGGAGGMNMKQSVPFSRTFSLKKGEYFALSIEMQKGRMMGFTQINHAHIMEI